ncbi:MAG: FAD-dependent oxidoreductase [Nitrososphaeria archaeon]
MEEVYDVIIVGAGISGLSAGIYACRKKMNTLIISKDIGGQALIAKEVENYPGVERTSGAELVQKVYEQALGFGAQIIQDEVISVEKVSEGYFRVRTLKGEYFSRSLIIAAGKLPRDLKVPGEDRFKGSGVSYCATCLPPGEEVVANDSLKKIDDIGISQKVLTIDGSFQDINEIISRDYEGEIVEIRTRFFTEPVKLTSNHPVLTTKVSRDYYRKTFVMNKLTWKEAGSLTLEDLLLYPIISRIEDIEKIRFSDILNVEVENGCAKNGQETYTSHRVSNEILVNEKFLRLVGYYLAEGCITRHGINFYFNKNEKEYIDDVKNLIQQIFHLDVHIKTENNVARISIFSKLIRDLFHSLFGKNAPNKKIPNWMLFLPLRKQEEIIKGFYRGDGCLRDKDFCMITTSRTLAYQLRDILLRFGIIPSIQKREKAKLNKTLGEVGGRKIRFSYDKYHIIVGGSSLEEMSRILGVQHPLLNKRKKVCRHAWIRENYLLLPIRKIKKENYRGKVFNLTVDGSNTYVAKNFIVHNCDAPLFRNKSVIIVGEGDIALDAALLLAKYAKEVNLITRRASLFGDKELIEMVLNTPNIKVLYETSVKEITGTFKVEKVLVETLGKGSYELQVDGVFVELGYEVNIEPFKSLVTFDERNQIIINNKNETKTSGVFACGDITDTPYKQLVISAAEGAKAALSAYEYVQRLSGKHAVTVDWHK